MFQAFPARVGGTEILTTHMSILGRIKSPAGRPYDGIEAAKQVRGRLIQLREIQSQCHSWHGKGHQPWRSDISETFQHCQEGVAAPTVLHPGCIQTLTFDSLVFAE